ncbi:MAG: glycosyltransferase family 2 protein [Candidatus Peribacteraceae bacterium]|nr:glycosyltransferase family 2 protein [Candidatus Peribacteraceae bacterium]
MQLSIVLPCFNEEQNIERTVTDVAQWFGREKIDGEIVVVDDGSTDGTAKVLARMAAQMPLLKIVTHPKNQGYGSAVRSGCDAAAKEFMGYMDSDGQFNVEDFGQLLPFLQEYEFVTGRRIKRADPFIRMVNAKLYGFLVWVALGVWVRDVNCAMKVWKASLWPMIRPIHSTGALINGEIFYRLHRHHIPWKQIPVHHYPRLLGKQTGANIRVILKMFRDLFALKKTVLREGN